MSRPIDDPSTDSKIAQCEEVLQHRFRDRRLLELALTHASVSRTRIESNERLEFLGDAILGAIICELLYHRFPDFPEGELTRIKSSLVSRTTCAVVADELGLDRFLLLGKGLLTRSQIPASILAGVFESVVAAVYLDGGFEQVRPFVERAMARVLEQEAEPQLTKNYKSLLQQMSQKQFGATPLYHVLDEKGPDHSKCFKISAAVGPQVYTAAWGSSKKEAEQRAALNALCEIEGKPVPHEAD
jgi:ribonuclease III